jgi:uncharacterized protein (UPF0264 family)
MTKLLVSVRDASEAPVALEAGAALIDVKEPLHGSLGAADPRQIEEVCRLVAGRVPVSAALGELLDNETFDARRLPESLAFAKLGLAGCGSLVDWPQRWSAALASLSASTRPVAVIYADWTSAASPPPEQILDQARRAGCAAVLVDTYDKSRGSLLAHWTIEEVARLVADARQRELLIVLAGSLTAESIDRLLPLAPDYLAVRGAVCRQSRTASLDGDLVAKLVQLVSGSATSRETATPGPR